ncbi:hypothetical protein [Phenylobacterium deserti]|uniref:Permease n=1 Tax=Phenylobacterium deserti TaxID=1914756 RepID=A0A328AH51_9CAUL|nr:hypothetical protein [Phenylobacterium deserti]RAK52694.1 hypothetical protein DJ018_10890 [Phenylobacterium deserti]
MDFLKLLRSFEDLIFEVATWLLFYPRTLWRIFVGPIGAMTYSDAEQADPEDQRYDDAISPPLFLLLTVVLVNAVGMALHVPTPQTSSETVRAILNSPQNAALFRALLFSLIPLVAASSLLGRRQVPLSRQSLRPPFYAQCFLVSPFALVVGIGGIILQRPDLPNAFGAALLGAGCIWLLTAQTRWFASRTPMGTLRALIQAIWCLFVSVTYLLLILIPVAFL